MANDLIASMVLAIWLYLLAARGGFWLAAERDDRDGPGAGSRGAVRRNRYPANVGSKTAPHREAGPLGNTS